MAANKQLQNLLKGLIATMLVIESLWTLNLFMLFVTPIVSTEMVPRLHYIASCPIEIESFTGIAYTEEQAVELAQQAASTSLALSVLSLILGAVALGAACMRNPIAILRNLMAAASLTLFIFVLFLL